MILKFFVSLWLVFKRKHNAKTIEIPNGFLLNSFAESETKESFCFSGQ